MLITALSLILNIQYSKHHQFKNNRSTICFIVHHCPSLRFFNNSASFNPFSRITLIFKPNSVILQYRFPYFESNFLSISKPNHGLTNGCRTAFLILSSNNHASIIIHNTCCYPGVFLQQQHLAYEKKLFTSDFYFFEKILLLLFNRSFIIGNIFKQTLYKYYICTDSY